MVLAGDDNLTKAYFSDLRPIMEEGRLPVDYVPRQYRGVMPKILSRTPGTIAGDRILSYFPTIVEAITQPIGPAPTHFMEDKNNEDIEDKGDDGEQGEGGNGSGAVGASASVAAILVSAVALTLAL